MEKTKISTLVLPHGHKHGHMTLRASNFTFNLHTVTNTGDILHPANVQLASYSSYTVVTKNVRIFDADDGRDAEMTGSAWLEPKRAKTLIYAR